MHRYVPYIRTKEGHIERIDFAIFSSDKPVDTYPYEEALVGWPEPQVFWKKEEGPSIGVAPIPNPMD